MSSIMSSPAKRKREVFSDANTDANTETQFILTPHADDGGSSPRTRVASRFGSLVIEERGAKRVRSEPERSEGDTPAFEHENAGEDDNDEQSENAHDGENAQDGSEAFTFDTFERSDNTSEAVEDTPTLRGGLGGLGDTTDYTPIDPLRASLTWQDDEITVYDPNDKDDDGTGVNGIGFKPTPAIAHARALKRRQQLAEYRKREEREARARRSRRRPRVYGRARSRGRGGSSGGSGGDGRGAETNANANASAETETETDETEKEKPESTRRVRFLETGPVTIRFLEPEVAV